MSKRAIRKPIDIKGPEPETPMFTLPVLADILNVTERILRYYHDLGVLVPTGESAKRKLYSINDVKKAKFIQFLFNDRNLSIAGIKIILQLFDKFNVSPDNYMELIDELETKTPVKRP